MIWDTLASLLCGLIALCLFTLHIVSSPKRDRWMTLPALVRFSILPAAIVFLLRAVNFHYISPDPWARGHINLEGFLAIATVAYMMLSLTVWIVFDHMKDKGWDRVWWVKQMEKSSPGQVPVMMDKEDVVQTLTFLGTPSVGPQAPPREAIRVGGRSRLHER